MLARFNLSEDTRTHAVDIPIYCAAWAVQRRSHNEGDWRRVSLVDEWKGAGGGGGDGQFSQGKDCSCVKHGSKKAL